MCFEGDDDGERAVRWVESIGRARKPYVCCECDEPIPVGAVYERVKGLFRGDGWTTWRTCARCYFIRHAIGEIELAEGCGVSVSMPPHGELAEALENAREQHWTGRSWAQTWTGADYAVQLDLMVVAPDGTRAAMRLSEVPRW